MVYVALSKNWKNLNDTEITLLEYISVPSQNPLTY
jgi:hypothetical protein